MVDKHDKDGNGLQLLSYPESVDCFFVVRGKSGVATVQDSWRYAGQERIKAC